MRIALTGAHATGKSTLAAELARALPDHRVIEEPYYQLDAEGHAFAAVPTPGDFEMQLERSLRNVAEERGAAIFDRCPADYVAYCLALGDAGRAVVARWFLEVRAAIATLDLLVFVSVERSDRIVAPEQGRLRRRMDAALRAGLLADEWGLGATVLEVRGPVDERVAQVLAHLAMLPRASDRRDAR